jgi:formylglycine-generating enzyme required for sulfatase activity
VNGAILTADMENFSSRMRADESSVITLLLNTYYRRAQEAVDAHGGRLFRREGDAIWCWFPSVQAAVDAGLGLLSKLTAYNWGQAEQNQIRLRVGVAAGELQFEGDTPAGPVLAEAKRLESAGRVGSVHLRADLLAGLQCPTVPEVAGESALLAAPQAVLQDAPRSWIAAVDLSQAPPAEVEGWLSWAIAAAQRRRARVFEAQDLHYVVIWPGEPPLRSLPFVLPEASRAALVHGPVGEDLALAADPAFSLLEICPDCPGLWSDCSEWDWQVQGGDPVHPLFYRGPAGEQAFSMRAAAPPVGADQRVEGLARAFANRRAAVILAGPWGSPEEIEALPGLSLLWEEEGSRRVAEQQVAEWDAQRIGWLEELAAPVYTWFDDPRLASKRLLAPREDAWAAFADDPLLRSGELIWVCPPRSQEWLKLLFADYEFRFENARPGLLVHGGWDEREERRWRRRGFDWIAESPLFFEQLAQHARFHGQLRLEKRRLAPLPSRPYKFLNFYTREDRAIFFGREAEIERLRQRLFSSWVLVVFGKSGVGKTSLLRAGLLSQFQAPEDLVVTLRMLSDPVGTLRALLCRTLGLAPAGQTLAQLLEMAESRVSGRVIVVLDQFEEFFLRSSPAQRLAFGEELAGVHALTLRRTHLILSLREDFLAQMSELETSVPSILKQRFRVSALEREQALQAMLKPAQLFGLAFEQRVVEDLMQQLDQGGIEPPQLQIVLDRLYDQRQQRQVSWEAYQELGGAQRLLQGYFEEALRSSLGPDTQRARQLLKRMITTRRTKLVVTLDELETSLGWPPENIAAVLKLLVESRLVRSWEEDDEGRYELAHDFLVHEVARWETPEEVAAKHAQSVLRNESRNYTKLGMVIPADRLLLLEQQAPLLSVSPDERAMLVRSAVLRGLDPGVWMRNGSGVDVLLQVLDEPVDGDVTRSVIAHLAQCSLGDVALERTLQAVREVGNPHLLGRLGDLPPKLRSALEAAVRERFFGPSAMVDVPAGPAWLGSTAATKEARKAVMRPDLHERVDSEMDYTLVEVPSFRIDRLLVSNAEYAEFRPLHVHFFPPEEHHLPATNVSHEEAMEYAGWLGKKLPSEVQWEKAARGTDGRLFPWGNEFDGSRCNSAESGLRTLLPVNSHPSGASPYGCVGMVGNVWEWTSTVWEPGSPLIAKKGGCALNFEPLMHCSARFEDPPEMRLRWAGFRLIDESC